MSSIGDTSHRPSVRILPIAMLTGEMRSKEGYMSACLWRDSNKICVLTSVEGLKVSSSVVGAGSGSIREGKKRGPTKKFEPRVFLGIFYSTAGNR